MPASHAFIASIMVGILAFAAGAIWAHNVMPPERIDPEEEAKRRERESAR